jgi:predicted anti-sigma-YlaC factor YlaD
MESLLAESPTHRGLLLAAASGFTQYGYAFVQQDADELESSNVAGAQTGRERARRLYLRARDYGLRGLAVAHPDFSAALRRDPRSAVRACDRADVPLLYWTAASWAAAIAVLKDRPDLIAELPQAEALIDRALALDEGFDHGAIHAFLISYEMARAGAPGDPTARAAEHFDRAVALGGGQQASPLVAFAESVCIQKQDRARFESLLRQALAVDADASPSTRLVNLVMQRRARWLLARTDELFLPGEKTTEKKS